MKKLLIVLLLFTLTACDGSKYEPLTCDPGFIVEDGECVVEIIDDCGYGVELVDGECVEDLDCNDCDEGYLLKKKDYNVVGYSDEFEFDREYLTLYEHSIEEGILYVNIEDFVKMLDPALLDISKLKKSTLVYDYYFWVDEEMTETYRYFMEFDAEDNTIYFNDITMLNYMVEYGSEYEDYLPNVEMIDFSYLEGYYQKTIYLDDYDFDMLKYGRQYFLPVHIANLIFGSSYLNVVVGEDDVYIFDDIFTYPEYLLEIQQPTDVNENDTIRHSVNYLQLVMENFYGLDALTTKVQYYNEAKGILSESTSLIEFGSGMFNMIAVLDDVHTDLIDLGIDGDQLDVFNIELGENQERFGNAYYDLECFNVNDEVRMHEREEYYILEINAFSLDTKDIIAEETDSINPDKPIMVDLTCNTGGMLLGVLDIIPFFTDYRFDLNYIDKQTRESASETYRSIQSKSLDNDFIFVTSPVTFSAGNLFASIIQDEDLGPVYGQRTAGGGSSVGITVLPNNMILSYSSTFTLLNTDEESIEGGIEPDFEVENPLDFDYIFELYNE